jgi:hypothetical protein
MNEKKIIYNVLLLCTFIYNWLTYIFIKILPNIIYISTHNIINNKFDLCIYTYKYKHKNMFYNIKFINNISFEQIEQIIKMRNVINHCCIIKNDVYVKDITEDIREFMHYFNNDTLNFDIQDYIKCYILNDDSNIHIYLNDFDSTEIIL